MVNDQTLGTVGATRDLEDIENREKNLDRQASEAFEIFWASSGIIYGKEKCEYFFVQGYKNGVNSTHDL